MHSPPSVSLSLSPWVHGKITEHHSESGWAEGLMGEEGSQEGRTIIPLQLSNRYPGPKQPALQTWSYCAHQFERVKQRSRTERACLNWEEYMPGFRFHGFRKVRYDSSLGEPAKMLGVYLPLFPLFLLYYHPLYFWVLSQISVSPFFSLDAILPWNETDVSQLNRGSFG